MSATEAAPIPVPTQESPDSLFKFSQWVHVGVFAGECEGVDEELGTNQCEDPGHFHAWCRLPNALQRRGIREQALAAKSRRIRQLRNQGSDSNETLEQELEDLLALPDSKNRMAEELVAREWSTDYLEAIRVVGEMESTDEGAEEGELKYDHIEDDKVRLARLREMPEADRNVDEWEDLGEHLAEYGKDVSAAYEAIVEPKRQSLTDLDDLDLLDLVRRERVKALALDEFNHHYSVQEWLSCAYTQRAKQRKPIFQDMAELEEADETILEALGVAFMDLEQIAREAISGN